MLSDIGTLCLESEPELESDCLIGGNVVVLTSFDLKHCVGDRRSSGDREIGPSSMPTRQ